MNESYKPSQPRFLTEDLGIYTEETQQQLQEALDSELSMLVRIPESDEVLAMDAEPEDKHLSDEVKAALVLAARARRSIDQRT